VSPFHNTDNKRLFEERICQAHVSLVAFNRHLQLSNWGALNAENCKHYWGARIPIYTCAADWSACLVAEENIDGKENGEAAGLDERGHSYTQDPRAREDKDHGNCAPTEAKRGSAVYAGI
jgi:hypothetical protein